MNDSNERRPQSLFGENDIRHSVDTVDERWGREMARRKRLAAKIFIPLFIIIVGGGLTLAKINNVFPFQQPPAEGPTPEEMAKQNQKAEKSPVEKLGYEKAKLRIYIICDDIKENMPKKLMNILYEATDLKPSEIYVEIWEKADAPGDLAGGMPSSMKLAFFLNGNPLKETPDTEKKLLTLINDNYSYFYKYDKLLIDPENYGVKPPTEEEMKERTEKRIEREKEENFTLPSLKFERK